MRKSIFIILCLTIISGLSLHGQKAQDILQKAIAYHDPQGNWDNFSGKMQHVTIFSWGYIVNETLELDRSRDYYCSTVSQDFGKIVRGMEGKKAFFSVNDKAPESEEMIQNWSLTEDGIAFNREQHTCHFGLLMHIRTTGMVLAEEVEIVQFDGRTCYALKFTGETDQVIHPFYQGYRTLYIDKINFELRGVQGKVRDYDPYSYYFSNYIEVDGIKVPHSRVFIRNDGYRFTSVNMPIE